METLDDQIIEDSVEHIETRKELLPKWIIVFSWIFIILSFTFPIGILFDLLDFRFHISLYGFKTFKALSSKGVLLCFLLLLKSIVGFGLIKRKDWAIKAALLDGAVGILICAYALFLTIKGAEGVQYQIDLLFLIPYFIKMLKIQQRWESTTS